ncbi:MAG: threonine/serine exporter family protein [Oscillospiraceae bacterium]
MPDQKKILDFAVDAGEILLNNGAEIFRVQDTMEMIAQAYNANTFHAYVLTNGIFASVDDEGHTHNGEIRHVPSANVHMGRIVAVNSLSRRIVEGKVPLEAAQKELNEIRNIPYSRNIARIGACAVGSACFSYLFGGTVFDALAAFIAGIFLQFFILFAEKRHINKIILNILAAAIVSVVSFIVLSLGLGNSIDKIIIGAIIPLVPGMAMTTGIRDFANGDYLSGTIRMIDALLIGGSIAIGVGAVLIAIGSFTGVAI